MAKRRGNPFLAEYFLHNKGKRRGGHRRSGSHRHNPPMGVAALRRPSALIEPTVGAIGGVALPITIGNFLMGYLGSFVPASLQTGMGGTLVRGVVRGGVAWALDKYVVGKVTHSGAARNGYRIGATLGVAGSALLDFIGRPLIIGPGDANLWLGYPLTAAPLLTPSAVAGYMTAAPQRQLRGYVRNVGRPSGALMGNAGGSLNRMLSGV